MTLQRGVLSVRDHGLGLPTERDLPHVFDRFYRADDARRLPGSGLGLAIVRQTAEAHGGWARASNAEGGGARLEVYFGPAVPCLRRPRRSDVNDRRKIAPPTLLFSCRSIPVIAASCGMRTGSHAASVLITAAPRAPPRS